MKKKQHKEGNNERWLLTYSDLITLLMIFFIILYSSSNVNLSKYQAMSESFKGVMGGGKNIIGTDEGTGEVGQGVSFTGEEKSVEEILSDTEKNLQKYLNDNNLQGGISTKIEERGLIVTLSDNLFFDQGKAEIKTNGKDKLTKLGDLLKKLNNDIRIEGNTDNIPIKNNEFDSNWQLASTRATNVAEFLINKGGLNPKKVSVVSYGEYRPLGDNGTAEGRQKNRRVDIVILKEGLEDKNN